MTDFTLPLRPDLVNQVPYGAPQDSVQARLNVNENPFTPGDQFRQALAEAVFDASAELNRYPDRDAVKLRQAIARYIKRESDVILEIDRIWAANGSNEVMSHVFGAFGGPGHSVLTFSPTYSMYPEYARDSFTEYISLDRSSDLSIDPVIACDAITANRPSLVLIASPNNPTGTAITLEHLRQIIECAREVNALVVVDEAYAEFRRDSSETAVRLLDSNPNVIVTRTLSKAFGFAGARVGYCLTSTPDIVAALMLVRLPYHLSAITQAVAVTALDHDSELSQQVAILRSERDLLATELTALGLEVSPSDANFIFFGTFDDRHAVWKKLYDRGVLIRETGPDRWLRVSVGTPAENQLFLSALREVVL